jgi:hypothetical protein
MKYSYTSYFSFYGSGRPRMGSLGQRLSGVANLELGGPRWMVRSLTDFCWSNDDTVKTLGEMFSENKSKQRRGMDLRVDLEFCDLG